jgi:hypothetical protein
MLRARLQKASRLGLAAVVASIAVLLTPAAASAAVPGPQLLTFGDYETTTEISTQYMGQGIVFKDELGYFPEIRWDESALSNPVLSGTFGFGSPISAEFVIPGTTTPATVENLAMDVGYINEPGSTQLVVNHAGAAPSVLFAEEYGFNHLLAGGGNISGFQLEPVGEEPAGFVLDNLAYTVPAPPPPPPPPPPAPVAPACPRFKVYDSRGSGEKKGAISKPGSKFLLGFLERLRSLHGTGRVEHQLNSYDAVGVWSFPDHAGELLNGLGAVLHAGQIGDYWESVRGGEEKLRTFISRQLNSACGRSARTKMILLGYSQGAQVTGNVYQDLYPQMDKLERRQIGAVVLWGDPRFNPLDLKANREDHRRVGLLGPRSKFSDPEQVFSYCNTHDPICQEPQPAADYLHYRGKEHSLYWTTDQAKNNGSAVASFLVKRH